MGAAFSESRKQLPGDDRLDAGRDALGGAVTVDDPAHEDSGRRMFLDAPEAAAPC
jgi:hypothetical protein